MANSSTPFHKILYMTFAAFPSTAAHSVNVIKMCEALARLGYKLTLTAYAREKEKDIFKFYRIKYPFDIKRIRLSNVRFIGRISFLIKAYYSVQKNTPDLLYTRDIFNGFLAKILKLPFVLEIHELPHNPFRKWILKQILSSDHLELLVLISEKLKEFLKSEMGNLFDSHKYLIAHDGVNLKDFDLKLARTEIRKILDLPEKAFIAGYIGGLFEGRGLEVILKLSTLLKDVIFVIVGGEGKYLASFNEKVKELKLNNLIAKGFVPYEMIPFYLRASDILLMPYQTRVLHRQKKHDTASYMSPLKMFEYMASGRPIISSDIKVLKEVLTDRDNALLANPEEIDEWVEAVALLKREAAVGENLGNKARKDVEKYSWDERARNIMESI
ncbi:MAG: glycosyltransferase family 4 protein [Candidatus Aminicenantes bacterium]|nr:MAG: glycosyltransferase family 4 protein [Candidatus Aminicenantes bacterium]